MGIEQRNEGRIFKKISFFARPVLFLLPKAMQLQRATSICFDRATFGDVVQIALGIGADRG